jgi:histidinol-phosphate phosphatase family domain/HAD-superfamily hydrolase, subfamily IIIA
MILENLKIDSTWTLFLDRDGVINKRIEGDYIRSWEQFVFLPGAEEAFRIFSVIFGPIIVVSNQQGIGKGLMTENDVQNIHEEMILEIQKRNGRIDKTYYSPFLDSEKSIHRKPNVGMALKARRDFPEIRFKKSIMAGDSISDMIFGKRLKMKTVFLCIDSKLIRQGHDFIDYVYPDLLTFANDLSSR